MDKIKIGIVGMGVMGRNHYRVMKSIAGAEVVAVCDQAKPDGVTENFYVSVDDMIKNEHLDGVIIATPTVTHKEISLKCIEKGINVLIEKPVASISLDGYEILKKAEDKKVAVVIGHIERFNPVVIALKNELQNKEIYSLTIFRVGPFSPRIADVGILTDLSVHDIDLIRYLTNKDISRATIYKSRKIHNHHEDNAFLSFELEGDIVAGISTSWLTPFKKRKIEVACKEEYYEADLMSQDLKGLSSYTINNSYAVRDCFVRKGEPLYNELVAFIDVIKNPAVKNNFATIQDSIKTLEILEGVK